MAKRRTTRTRPRPEPARHAPRDWRPVILAAALALAGAWAFAPGLGGVLVLDDVRAIARNPTIRTLWPLTTSLSPPTGSTVAGRPVANLSFAVNYALAPAEVRDVFAPADRSAPPGSDERLFRNLRGYHLFNIAVHLAAGLALFGIVGRTLRSERLRARFGESASGIAVAVAGLWLVHPLQTASITYLVQRVESLMGLFYLLALYCAIRSDQGVHTRLWTTASIAICALGMATKEVMVTAPIVAWLWLRTFGTARASREREVLLAGLAATWVVLGALVLREHRAPSVAMDPTIVWRYLLTQAEVVTHYLRLAVVPSPLVFLYTWPLASSLAGVALEAAFLTALLAATAAGIVRRHPLGFLGAWFFVILAPSSSLLPIVTEIAAEHRMYLPLASVVACAVLAAHAAGRLLVARLAPTRSRGRGPLAAGMLLTIAAIVVFGAQTRARSRDYWSEEALWRDTVAKQPANSRARVAYGETLAAARELPEAEAQLRAAVDLAPDDPVALVRLGTVQAAQGRMDEAIATLERAAAASPDDPDANRALGEALAMRGEDARATLHLERVAARVPDDAALLGRLAALLATSHDSMVRDSGRAVQLAERAVALTSRRDPRLLEILSVAQAAADRFAEAAVTAEEAVAIARATGDQALASQLEYRAAAYRAQARASAPR